MNEIESTYSKRPTVRQESIWFGGQQYPTLQAARDAREEIATPSDPIEVYTTVIEITDYRTVY